MIRITGKWTNTKTFGGNTLNTLLERDMFRREWKSVVFFLILVTLPTFWVLLRPATRLQEIMGTIVAAIAIGLIGAWFVYRERVPAGDIGLGGRSWIEGLGVFLVWWILVSIVDWLVPWAAGLFGITVTPLESLEWSWITVLDWIRAWLFVGFAEEIAFRGYLHNKLIVALGRRWPGMILAALAFGLWHVPGSLIGGNTWAGASIQALFFAAVSFLAFNLTYEWTGLLPFLALFHGWSDFPLVLPLRASTTVGGFAGYLLIFVVLGAYKFWLERYLKGERFDEKNRALEGRHVDGPRFSNQSR